MNKIPAVKMVYKTFFQLFCLSFLAFLTHFFLAQHFVLPLVIQQLQYSIPQLYVVFTAFSFFILGTLFVVRKNSLNYVGYAFLILTSVKMGVAYFLLRPILAIARNEFYFEKINFFIVFIFFLAIETLLTIRILNNKQ